MTDIGDLDSTTIIARALRAKFGDAAPGVARFQVDHATDKSLAAWQAVVRALSMN